MFEMLKIWVYFTFDVPTKEKKLLIRKSCQFYNLFKIGV